MQHPTLVCQPGHPSGGDSRLNSPRTDDTECPRTGLERRAPDLEFEQANDYSGLRFAPVVGAGQELANTKSRRSGPRRWRRAVEWLIAAGLHPRATATTLRVAEDLAARMDYDLGHVRYGLDDMAARLGMSRKSVTRHVKYLRELGALVWAVHGTRTNIRRALGLPGYAGTATVYAAVIPSVYDNAMGHRIIGSGYEARIVVDLRGTRGPVDNPAVDDAGSEARDTPSRSSGREVGQVQMAGCLKDTSQASQSKSRVPHQSSEIDGRRRTADDVKSAGKTVRLVRAMVNWTQSVGLRRLEYVLRPFTDRGLDAHQIAATLSLMCSGMTWKPARPDVFILARLAADAARAQQVQDAQEAAARWEAENGPVGAFRSSPAQRADVFAANLAGCAQYSADTKAHGLDDLCTGVADFDAEADMASFLAGSPA